MNKNRYILTSQDMLDLGLALNGIAMRLDDANYNKIKSRLDKIEDVLSNAKVEEREDEDED